MKIYNSEILIAKSNQYPYMASIYNQFAYDHVCSGVIVAHKWILTIAECVRDENMEYIEVAVGRVNRLDAIKFQLEDIVYLPPSSTPSTSKSDGLKFALLKLEKSLNFTDEIRAIETIIWNPVENVDGIIVGWSSWKSAVWS